MRGAAWKESGLWYTCVPRMPKLTRALLSGITKNGPTDPIEYYERPLVGYLFRERINMGLRLLDDRRFSSMLEIGYGAGALLLALAPIVDQMHGIDLDADPASVEATLRSRGHAAKLQRGDARALPYEDHSFDLVVSFSVFEHIVEYRQALREVARVLRPGGRLLLGMPAVNKAMDLGFRAIGFDTINDHHVTTPKDVARTFEGAGLRVLQNKRLGVPFPGLTLYYVWLLERKAP
jgi:SAM-dependent methyltransferase